MFNNDTRFIKTRRLGKIDVVQPRTNLSPTFCLASLIIFGISQVQNHDKSTMMSSVEKLFVFTSFLSRR